MQVPQKDPERDIVRQTVHNFVWEDKSFSFVEYIHPLPGYKYLEVFTHSESDKIKFPPFIKIEKDITDKLEYTSYAIAKYWKKDLDKLYYTKN